MSLKLKCNKCGFLLGFEVQNPGVIVVDPCEGCIQQFEDTAQPVVKTAGQFFATVDAEAPDMLGDANFEKLQLRLNVQRKQDAGVYDGSDQRPVAER